MMKCEEDMSSSAKKGNPSHLQVFEGDYDEDGVYVYQAYCSAIADFAVEHQRFGGDNFNPDRMVRSQLGWKRNISQHNDIICQN